MLVLIPGMCVCGDGWPHDMGEALNGKPARLEADALGQGRPPLEHRPEGGTSLLRAPCTETLTDKLNRAEVQSLLGSGGRVAELKPKRTPFGISDYDLAPRLKPVNRICQRWAVSIGNGQPNWAWDLPKKSRPTPLDDETAVVVDTIIMKKIPPSSTKFLRKWYRSDIPLEKLSDEMIEEYHGRRAPKLRKFLWGAGIAQELAETLQMTENGVVFSWNLTLDVLRDKFEESRHPELIRLLTIRWS